VGFAWTRHGGSLNHGESRVQGMLPEPQDVVPRVGMQMPSVDAKPSVQALGRISKTAE
jgi:hypothetical protein